MGVAYAVKWEKWVWFSKATELEKWNYYYWLSEFI